MFLGSSKNAVCALKMNSLRSFKSSSTINKALPASPRRSRDKHFASSGMERTCKEHTQKHASTISANAIDCLGKFHEIEKKLKGSVRNVLLCATNCRTYKINYLTVLEQYTSHLDCARAPIQMSGKAKTSVGAIKVYMVAFLALAPAMHEKLRDKGQSTLSLCGFFKQL